MELKGTHGTMNYLLSEWGQLLKEEFAPRGANSFFKEETHLWKDFFEGSKGEVNRRSSPP